MTRSQGIDESLVFHPLHIAVLTISDTRTAETDASGRLLVERATGAGHRVIDARIVPDDVDAIRKAVTAFVTDPAIDLVITTGGTGFAPRDVTPEAIRPLLTREMDGFAVLFHQVSLGTIGVSTLQSRAFAGQAQESFVFCLPGSTGACRDAWDHIFAFELDSRFRPCSLAGQIGRLRELCP